MSRWPAGEQPVSRRLSHCFMTSWWHSSKYNLSKWMSKTKRCFRFFLERIVMCLHGPDYQQLSLQRLGKTGSAASNSSGNYFQSQSALTIPSVTTTVHYRLLDMHVTVLFPRKAHKRQISKGEGTWDKVHSKPGSSVQELPSHFISQWFEDIHLHYCRPECPLSSGARGFYWGANHTGV